MNRDIYETKQNFLARLNQVDRNQSVLWYPGVTFVNSVNNKVTVIDEHTRSNVLRHTKNIGNDPALAQEGMCLPAATASTSLHQGSHREHAIIPLCNYLSACLFTHIHLRIMKLLLKKKCQKIPQIKDH